LRRIFAFIVTTLDGYYEGRNGEFDWPVVDDEFNAFSLGQLGEIDTLLFGRVTYQGMASYWPTPAAHEADPKVAALMKEIPKLVVSRTLDTAHWVNTRILEDVGALNAIKRQPGKDIGVLGSSKLTAELIRLGLLDELRIMVNPVALGDGQSLFRTAHDRIELKLASVRPFDSGNVLLSYQPNTRV
jgi:dihydrofolate reductase